MTDKIIVSKRNESQLNIDCENSILRELAENFTFYVDGYKHMPKFKAGVWNGQICLLDLRFGTLPLGLYNNLKKCAEELEYEVEARSNEFGSPSDKDCVSKEEVISFIDSLNIHANGNPITARDYQIEAIHLAINDQRKILIVPTAGGKSFIGAVLMRWYLDKGCNHVLYVVPTLGLLNQIKADLEDYFSESDFIVSDNIQLMGDGRSREITKPIVFSTWQSIYKLPNSWYNSVDVIIGDEAHSYKADAAKGIFEKATNTKYKFGMTGSLDKSVTNKMVLEGIIGESYQIRTTRELIDDGSLSDLKIKCLLLKYGKETKKLFKQTAIANHVSKVEYPDEITFLCAHDKRNKFIRNLALIQKGVTLILFNQIEHGKLIFESIKSKATTQDVYYISGEVDATKREEIRNICKNCTGDAILVASMKTTSTGINVPNISNIIFAHPTKSVISVMQSIGRGLRKAEGKKYLTLYDIADAINTSKTSANHTFRHFSDRLQIYCNEEHPYDLLEVELEK